MGKMLLVLLLAAASVAGYRAYSQYELEERASRYSRALYDEALATQRGSHSIPSREHIRREAERLAGELGLQIGEIEVSVTEAAHPVGLAGMAADRLGELAGQADVAAGGDVERGPARSLKTTLIEIRVPIRADGFLCSLNREARTSRNFGFAIQ